MHTPFSRSPAGDWELDVEPPKDWGESVVALDGGFFHSPPGLHVGAPVGTPIYARYRVQGAVAGLALGVQVGCRMSRLPRHAYFPTWPVFAAGVDRIDGITRLAGALRDRNVAEAQWDSYDAGAVWPAVPVASRYEYPLPLGRVGPAQSWPEATTHRRTVRRGDREGFQFRALESDEAAEVLTEVLAQASARGAERGVRFSAPVPEMVRTNGVHGQHWGIATYAAFRGQTLLAAALVGHGPTRAYYVQGGATPDGYDLGASIWLHARIAGSYATLGLREYNLGGVPATALDPVDPAHGLHRFKYGFGARVTPCAGGRWDLGPIHSVGHRVARWAESILPEVLR